MAGGVAHRASALQGASPEFKPQYHKKKKEEETRVPFENMTSMA
jgi:hypothetical protein